MMESQKSRYKLSIFLILGMMTLIHPQPAKAANECIRINKKESMIAVVERINRQQTWLYVINEQTGRPERFYAPRGYLKELEPGDRVRIYYICGSQTLLSVRHMTPVEFDAEASNRGYIMGGPK